MSAATETKEIPEEFEKIIKDLVNDLHITFPEYDSLIAKWWKPESSFESIENEEERNEALEKSRINSTAFIFKFCLRKFPPRFFDLLYKNVELFNDDSELDTEFLPQIHFKNLMSPSADISEKTRETLWKYLQLVMFSIIGSVKNKDAFGDTANLFDAISQDEFKGKLEETLSQMQGLFEGFGQREGAEDGAQDEQCNSDTKGFGGINMENMPNASDIHNHINGMLGGKLGQLAKEIAEETASELNMNMEDATDVKGVFQNLMKNPGKMMGLVKNIGSKLDTKLKSGDLKESELIAEASEIMSQMKNMPGMGNIQEMLSKMGMGGLAGLGGKGGGKMNFGAMESMLNKNMKTAQMKERMKAKVGVNAQAQAQAQAHASKAQAQAQAQEQPQMTEEELLSIFSSGDKVERTPRGQKPNEGAKKKKGKGKK